MLTALYPWLVFVHVVSAFGFVLVHGVAVFVAFRIRQECDRSRIAALLDLSAASLPLMYGLLLIVVASGITAGGIGGWLGRLWIWAAIGALVVVAVAMGRIASPHYLRIRQLVGASISPRQARALPPLSSDCETIERELAARLHSRRAELLAAVGGGGLLIVIWLMLVKPF
jgi:hypothetical protein